MKVYVINKTTFPFKEVLKWCLQQFKDVVQIHGPINAELHRVSYDNSVTNIVVFYFRDERDYLLFCLRWQ